LTILVKPDIWPPVFGDGKTIVGRTRAGNVRGREHLVNEVGAWHVVVQAHLGPCGIEGDAIIHDVLAPLDHGRLAAARATEKARAC